MSLMKLNVFGVLLLCVFCSVSATAKRVAPRDVPPVTANGIRYSAEGDGRDSYVVATDAKSGQTLWRVKVFHTRIKFWQGEEDNQWLFISDLKLSADSLFARDEKNRCYSINLNTRRVRKMECGNAFPPQRSRG
jgi:hypothetical protein